ncbi:MAG: type II toxin-antitoxin system mRNA interferase toxin, RelE/StbE family [Candidatus Sungbacteria bacterium]|nr:type II toxin-antitoxin system mRNA interferase toxin, RelE/StbE family [Candidatus Sungbacteria bacterium]
MNFTFHRQFRKHLEKLNHKQRQRVRERLHIFLDNPFHSALNNHALKGKYLDYRSINITGDLRAIYKSVSEDECIFVALDTHSNLYP